MRKLILVLIACLALVSLRAMGCGKPGEPSNCGNEAVEVSDRVWKLSEGFSEEVQQGRMRERTNGALNAMIRFAAFKLKTKGHKKEAALLVNEWETRWNGYLMRVGRDIGDHRPLSQWLAEKYDMLELILGVDICHMLRLDDLKTVNYGIPVVFSCVDNVDVVEFEKHFVPFSGVVIYWTSFFTCVGGTWGTGFLFCSPISWGCEFVTEKWIAPKLNETVWGWSCH